MHGKLDGPLSEEGFGVRARVFDGLALSLQVSTSGRGECI
jgi:hypothetical protein